MNRDRPLDIHNFVQQYESAEANVRNSEISPRNKELILAYRDACILHHSCGRVRLIRAFIVLLRAARILQKDFDVATKQDIERVMTSLINDGLRPWTLATYRAFIKRFYCWLLLPEEFPRIKQPPAIVSWLICSVRQSEELRLDRHQLLTPSDIEALLKTCRNTRDRALISMLWESGCRVAELGNLQLHHVNRAAHGYTLDVKGKTGTRSPLLISSAPHLTVWLNSHPRREDPDSPLWVYYQFKRTGHLKYDSIRYILKRYFERAKIAKPFHPHIFRHSRATYLLANKLMNEQQAKSYFGWTPGSDMLANYSHLIDQDANNAILAENHLSPERSTADQLQPIVCPFCKELNLPTTPICTKCNNHLEPSAAYRAQEQYGNTHTLLLQLCQTLLDKGLIDEATATIHDANLGRTLKALATKDQLVK